MKNVSAGLAALLISCLLIYGTYFIAKNVSYWLFYEDMVKQTVIEMVKPESLK